MRSARKHNSAVTRRSGLSPLWALCALACGPRVPSAEPSAQTVENTDRPLSAGDRVKLVELAGQPPLQVIRRAGDPKGAVALAVFPPGGSRESLLLTALLKYRTGAFASPPKVQVHGIGTLLSWEVNDQTEARSLLDGVHQALTTPVTEKEAAEWSPGIDAMLDAARARVDGPSETLRCLGALGAEGREVFLRAKQSASELMTELEQLRKKSGTPARVGLSVLGSNKLLHGIEAAHNRSWPSGEEVDDAWVEEVSARAVDSKGGREIQVALRLSRSDAALAAARTLSSPSHALHARLAALDSRFAAEEPEVALRPAGACVSLSAAYDPAAQAPSVERVAEVASLLMEELRSAVAGPVLLEERALALLAPQGALEGAALGAWTAVRSPRTGNAPAEFLEYRRPDAHSAPPGKATPHKTSHDKTKASEPSDNHAESETFRRAVFAQRDAWKKQVLPLYVREEPGQPELFMLLASPCGTAPETEQDAGLRALSISTLARNFDNYQGVALRPWISPEGLGLIAHAAAVSGERPTEHARRVARALARALRGPPIDGRAVAVARDAQLDRLSEDPGENLLMSVVGAGYPSLLFPYGTEKSIATLSGAHVESVREDLLEEPLILTVLENSESPQAEAAREALLRWFAPFRTAVGTCPVRAPSPAAPGHWNLETIEPEAREGNLVAVFSPAPRPLGKAVEFLLNRPDGYLDRALGAPGLAAHGEAEWVGSEPFGALVVRVGAERHLQEKAAMQVRALLDRLSERGATDTDVALAQKAYEQAEARAQRRPEGRLIQTHLAGAAAGRGPESFGPKDLTKARLSAFFETLAAEQHRLLTVTVRK